METWMIETFRRIVSVLVCAIPVVFLLCTLSMNTVLMLVSVFLIGVYAAVHIAQPIRDHPESKRGTTRRVL